MKVRFPLHIIGVLFVVLRYQGGLCEASPLDGVRSFGIQLQNIDIGELRDSPLDLIVIDYSFDGSEERALTAADVSSIRSGNGKKVIAYLSIGEAEEYRYYFRQSWIRKTRGKRCGRALTTRAPTWLDAPNKDWCGNYKVRYWDKRWQKIIFGASTGVARGYLDRIIDAGFDGVYLDIVDGYEYWKSIRNPAAQRRRTAAREMVRFVVALSNYAKASRSKSDFIVIPQNGSGILEAVSPGYRSRYLAAIDGIGAEDTFFFGTRDEDNKLNVQHAVVSFLGTFRRSGKKVFALDYLTSHAKISQFIRLACGQGYVPQVATRSLNSLKAESIVGCP